MTAITTRQMIQELLLWGPVAAGKRSRVAYSDTAGVNNMSHHQSPIALECVVIAVRSEKRVYHANGCRCYEFRPTPLDSMLERLYSQPEGAP